MKQGKRLGVYQEFSAAKAGEGMVLFATDIAARGLDFPTVEWVVQVVGGGRGAGWVRTKGGGGRGRRGENWWWKGGMGARGKGKLLCG